MLLNFNALSAGRYENAAVDFKRHTALLLDMKRELDIVFRLNMAFTGLMRYVSWLFEVVFCFIACPSVTFVLMPVCR